MTDPTTSDVLGALSTPLLHDATNMSRRRFLQAVGAGVAITALPTWMADAAAAASGTNNSDGVLVLLTMGGGNDGLNTFVPTGDGTYYDARGSLAVRPGDAINLGGGRGLNPNLPYMKTLWDQGNLAVIDGVGHQAETLSHFVSMAHVMAATNSRPPFQTGWLGRFLDDAGDNPFTGLSLGGSIPLLVKGQRRDAIGLPDHGKDILRTTDIQPTYARQNQAIRAFGVGSSGLGEMGDQIAASGRRAVDYAGTVAPMFDDRDDEARVVTKMRLAARLINANLGVRVISIVFGDFDSHAGQTAMHRDRMREINAGLKTFFATLDNKQRNRTLVVGTSEFGRRVASNGSGTDHGTANSLFVVGNQVKPGFHGQLPSLRNLDRYGNVTPTVDLMAFYATIATTWLGADDAAIFGGSYENLGFVNKPGTTPSSKPSTGGGTGSIRQRRARVARTYLALLGALPEEEQFEKVADAHVAGRRALESAATDIADSAAFRAAHGSPGDAAYIDIVYNAVHGRAATAAERSTWTNRFTSGTPRGRLVSDLIDVSEFVERTNPDVLRMEMAGPVGRLYYAYFLRAPKEQGLNYWINAGTAVPVISDNFASSSEFTRRYGSLTNRQFVELVYRNVLGRPAVPDGLDYWTSLLNQGRSRGQVMVGFANADEFKRQVQSRVSNL